MSDALVSAIWLLSGALFIVVATEFQKRWWLRGYFAFGELLAGFEYQDRPGVLAVAVKGSIAVVAGAIAAIGAAEDDFAVAALAGLVGSFALAWPVILGRGDAVPAELHGRMLELRLLHVMFVLSYGALAWAGGLAGVALSPILSGGLADVAPVVAGIARDFAVGALASVVGGLLVLRFVNRRSYDIKQEAQPSGRLTWTNPPDWPYDESEFSP